MPEEASLTRKRIRELRLQRGLTLEELAHRAGTGKSYMWYIENRDGIRLSARKLSRIAEVLETTVEYLLAANEDERHDAKGSKEKAEDTAFYNRYRNSEQPTKRKLRKILDVLSEKELMEKISGVK